MSTKTRSQKEIVDGLLAKDRATLGYLFDQYGGALLGVAKRIVGTKERAEEVLKDAFLKVWKNIEKFDSEKGRLFTWMLQITRNEAIDKRRSRISKEDEKTSSLDLHVYKLEEKDFEEMKIGDIGLRNVIAGLEDDAQEILNLIYFKGYTHKDVADQTGMPLGTVKTKLRRAILELRKVLDPT